MLILFLSSNYFDTTMNCEFFKDYCSNAYSDLRSKIGSGGNVKLDKNTYTYIFAYACLGC